MQNVNLNTKKFAIAISSSIIVAAIVIYGKICKKRGYEIGCQEGAESLRNLPSKVIPGYEDQMEKFYESLRSERENKK